jgi:hypothetical protein
MSNLPSDMNIGVVGGLLDWKHVEAMGQAVWLFSWLVLRQTDENGKVLGGRVITYEEIAADMKAPKSVVRTLKRWMALLKERDYIKIEYRCWRMMIVTVLKPKKYAKNRRANQTAASSEAPVEGAKNVLTKGTEMSPLGDKSVPTKGTNVARSGDKNVPFNKSSTAEQEAELKQQERAAPSAAPSVFENPPPEVPIRTWLAFVEMRKVIGRRLTPQGRDLVFERLADLKSRGHPPLAVLEQSIRHSWTDVYELTSVKGVRNGNGRGKSRSQERSERHADRIAASSGLFGAVACDPGRSLPGRTERDGNNRLPGWTSRIKSA